MTIFRDQITYQPNVPYRAVTLATLRHNMVLIRLLTPNMVFWNVNNSFRVQEKCRNSPDISYHFNVEISYSLPLYLKKNTERITKLQKKCISLSLIQKPWMSNFLFVFLLPSIELQFSNLSFILFLYILISAWIYKCLLFLLYTVIRMRR